MCSNRWLLGAVTLSLLLGAVTLSLLLQVAVVYVPFLQTAFGTVALGGGDWLLCVAVASSVIWLRELSKVVARPRITSCRCRLER